MRMYRKYLNRNIDKELEKWKNSVIRKPLLLRGARLTGKTSTVRELARQFDYFVEINFANENQNPEAKEVFRQRLTPEQICSKLSLIYKTPVVPGRTLLFFDEIQSSLPALLSLNNFYENYPGQHVIAAGAPLSFALQMLPLSGIGCVHSLSMYPFSFEEYLRAAGQRTLADTLREASPEKPYSEAEHNQYLHHLTRFMLAGGMPEVVATCVGGGSWDDCRQALDNSIHTLCNDFLKNKHHAPASRLHETLVSVVHQTGSKFNFSKVSRSSSHSQIKTCIKHLELAGIIYPVTHTSANGFPLAAEAHTKFRKYLIMDTGIYHRLLQPDLKQLSASENPEQVCKNLPAELFVGLELLKAAPCNRPVKLYYWQNETQNNSNKVEYLVQRQTGIIPVEVKPETKNARQGLLQFMTEKGYTYGIRCTLENFSTRQDVKNYPLYAAARIGE
jgi:predicted AAA+ superfamily ATPase